MGKYYSLESLSKYKTTKISNVKCSLIKSWRKKWRNVINVLGREVAGEKTYVIDARSLIKKLTEATSMAA